MKWHHNVHICSSFLCKVSVSAASSRKFLFLLHVINIYIFYSAKSVPHSTFRQIALIFIVFKSNKGLDIHHSFWPSNRPKFDTFSVTCHLFNRGYVLRWDILLDYCSITSSLRYHRSETLISRFDQNLYIKPPSAFAHFWKLEHNKYIASLIHGYKVNAGVTMVFWKLRFLPTCGKAETSNLAWTIGLLFKCFMWKYPSSWVITRCFPGGFPVCDATTSFQSIDLM